MLAVNPYAYNCGVGPVHVESQPNFSPDNVWSVEVGEKAKFDDKRISVNADIYYIKWNNIQQVLSLTCGYPYNTNAGNARSFGPELEVSALIVDGLTVDFSGAYNNAEINDPNANAQASGITPGTRVLNVPRFTATVGMTYKTAINDTLNGMFNISSSTVGDTRDQAAYPQILPTYTLVDARTGVVGEPLGGVPVRDQSHQQGCGTHHQQHGICLADLCDHARLDQPAAHRRVGFSV